MGGFSPSGSAKKKLKWSKLYSFACMRPCDDVAKNERHPEIFGRPGFSRVVMCNEGYLHRSKPYKYTKNYVSTTKYNVASFLPKALFEQFRRVANLYFLLAAVLSVTPFAPFDEPESLIAPLVFVVGISILKEAVEDWQRFLQDMKVNSRSVRVHKGEGVFGSEAWKEVCVGDIVKVYKDEYFPCDILMLSSSYEDGICYVETMNLDGETNLKLKRSLEATLFLDKDQEVSGFKATVRCEDPNPQLYTFVGNLELRNESHPLCPSQLLLRDSKLRNTDYVYGVVIFTGQDTKAVRNSTMVPSKRSRVEKKMDQVIYLLFSMLIFISLVTAIGFSFRLETEMAKWWYLRLEDKGVDKNDDLLFNPSKFFVSGCLQFVRALILYGYLIPISLYVSIEIVKVLQAMMINKDIEMYDDVSCKSVHARTSNLNEELGQVEMILTDKTGTLTCNQMEFRKCSIAGISYGGDINDIDLEVSKRMSSTEIEAFQFSLDGFKSRSQGYEKQNPSKENTCLCIKGFNFWDDRIMNKEWIRSSSSDANLFDTTMFFRVMALCHTGIPIVDHEKSDNKLKYEAESPEEVAFLIASQEFGFQFFRRTQTTMFLNELDHSSGKEVTREFKLLNLLEFSSSRKRMSVIVSNEDGQIFLLCKGADSIIFDRLSDNGRKYQDATTTHLSNYAQDGLRTLAFAYRLLDDSEYKRWNEIFTRAKTTIGPEREELLDTASDMVEKDLTLLGVVAIEDKLQKGVPECIDKLAQAGIKIWQLTGDKKETAINIGYACSLLRHDMQQFHLSLSKETETNDQLKDMKEDIMKQLESFYRVLLKESSRQSPLALVVDGKALEVALRNDVKLQFLRLAVKCDTVICCRVSPKQKALIARLVKKYSGMTILAIGDGANDVGMIQEADIGVGISGMEGMQAVMASDFSLPQFRFLAKLLLVHGHWCYKRLAKMILYFVYKNIAFGLTLFYYEIYTSFSGGALYDDWYMTIFNLLLTSLPVLSLGVLEQDVSSQVCLEFPALYRQGQRNTQFAWSRIIGWTLNGIASSIVVFLANVWILSPNAFREDGATADLSHLGAVAYTCVIWTVSCQMSLIINHFTWIHHVFVWGSVAAWYVFLFAYGSLRSNGAFRLLPESLAASPVYWLVTLLAAVVSLLPYFVHVAVKRLFFPMDDHVIQEMKYCKKDYDDDDDTVWKREERNSKKATRVGFSARVDARIRNLRGSLQKKKQVIYRSVANNPLFR